MYGQVVQDPLDDPAMLDDRQIASRLGLTWKEVQRLFETGQLQGNSWQGCRLVSCLYLEERIKEGIQLLLNL